MSAILAPSLKNTHKKITTNAQANPGIARKKTEYFRIPLENKYDTLEQEETKDIEETTTRPISESVVEVGGKASMQEVSNISWTTKDWIKKQQQISGWA